MVPIDIRAYMAYTLAFTPEENTLRAELMDWLPVEIVDSHAHSNMPEHVSSVDSRAYAHMLSTFPFSLWRIRRLCISDFFRERRFVPCASLMCFVALIIGS